MSFNPLALLGQIGQGAWSDIQGLAHTPGSIVDQIAAKKARDQANGTNPVVGALQGYGEMLGSLAGGTVNSYANTFGIKANNNQPLIDTSKAPFTPGSTNTSGVSFNPGAAGQNALNHPIYTALNLLPLIGPAKNLGRASKAATAVAPTAEESTIIGNLGKADTPASELPTLNQGVRHVPTPNVPDAAAKSYMSPYTVPTKLNLKPTEVAKWMINDKPNIQQIPQLMDSIETMKRSVLSSASNQGIKINPDNAASVGSTALDQSPQLKGTPALQGYKEELSRLMPDKQTAGTPGGAGTGGENFNSQYIGGANPLDTYDAIKNIEHKGWQYMNSSKDVNGTIKNWDLHNVANAYLDSAKQLEMDLDQAVGKENVQAYTQSPAIQQAVRNFSKPLASRLANNVQTWSDLRGLEKPYLDMQTILDSTERSGHTAFANLSGSATAAGTTAAGSLIGGAIGGPPGAVVGAIAGRVAEPFVAALGNKYLPPITANIAQAAGPIGSAVKNVGNVVKYGGPLAVGQSMNALPAIEANSPEGNNNNSQYSPSHATSLPQISIPQNLPPKLAQYQRDPQTGSYQLPTSLAQTPINSLYTYGQFQKDTQNLNLYNPRDKSTYDKLLTQYNMSQDIAKEYISKHPVSGDQMSFVNNDAQQANDILSQLYNSVGDKPGQIPTGVFNNVKQVKDLAQMGDPSYASFVTKADIAKGYGNALVGLGMDKKTVDEAMPDVGMPPREFLTKLDLLNRLIVNKYDDLYGPATFSSQALPGVPQNSFSTSPVSNYSGSRGLPTTPANTLPPITQSSTSSSGPIMNYNNLSPLDQAIQTP